MKKLSITVLSAFVLSACSSDEMKPSEVPNGSVDSSNEEFSQAINDLEVATITIIQEYDDLEVDIDDTEITFKKMSPITDTNGDEYENVFLAFGQYVDSDDNQYPFRSYFSYTEDDFDSSFSPLYYTSESNGEVIDVLPEDVDR
ncbi:hypothetical protein AAF695_02555 [Aerococcus viridans]